MEYLFSASQLEEQRPRCPKCAMHMITDYAPSEPRFLHCLRCDHVEPIQPPPKTTLVVARV
jgi:hypothetical protein